MIKSIVKITLTAWIFVLGAASLAALGKNDPAITVTSTSPNSRLININWSKVENSNAYKYGLYRVDIKEKTYSLIAELNQKKTILTGAQIVNTDERRMEYLDSNLAPPLTNYYYFVTHVAPNESLFPLKTPVDISDETMRPQLANADIIAGKSFQGEQQTGVNVEDIIAGKSTQGEQPDLSGESAAYDWSNNQDYVFAGSAAEDTSGFIASDNTYQSNNSYPFNIGNNTNTVANKNKQIDGRQNLNGGLYFGLVLFSNKIEAPPVLIPLDPTGRQEILETLKEKYRPSKANGTALLYAEHTALANLTKLENSGQMPDNLDSVNIITFTDGLDTSSTDISFKAPDNVSFAGKTTTAYKSYINQRMKTQKIAGKNINAWAIGIPGKDVINTNEFIATLEAVSSAPDHVAYLENLSEVERKLIDIGNNLNIFAPSVAITFNTPAFPIGTSVRLTFDNAPYAEGSNNYIEGKISGNAAGNVYSLTNLRAQGVNLKSAGSVTGKRTDKGDIEYTLVLNNSFDDNALMEWYNINPYTGANWQANSEFQSYQSHDFTSSRKSSIVYLVLDCSSSLSVNEIDSIRQSISMFVEKLFRAISDISGADEFASGVFTDTTDTQAASYTAQSYTAQPQVTQSQALPAQAQALPPSAQIPPAQAAQSYTAQSYTPQLQAAQSQALPTQALPPSAQMPQSQSAQAQALPALAQVPPLQAAQLQAAQPQVTQLQALPPQSQTPSSTNTISEPADFTYYQNEQKPAPAVRLSPAASARQEPPQNNQTTPRRTVRPTVVQTGPTETTIFLPAKQVNWADPYSGYWVQIGSFTALKNANDLWIRLYKAGCTNVEIFGKNIAGRTYYRVKVGPYQDRNAAESAKNTLQNSGNGFNDAFIDEYLIAPAY